MNGESSMKRSKERPFYQPPENVPTSSKIINEARTSLRTVSTKRPYTPREARTLFGPSSVREPENRPPSAFSLGSRHFDGADSRPVSGTRLSPLDHSTPALSAADLESRLKCPKPPTDPNHSSNRKLSGRSRLYQTGGEGTSRKSPMSPKDEVKAAESIVSSGCVSNEERGEGDGKDTPPSVLSRPTSSDAAPTHSSSEGSRKASIGQTDSDSLYQQAILPLLNEIMDPAAKRNPEKLMEIIDDLYNTLHEHELLGKACRRRSAILKALFKLLDVDHSPLLLILARLILSLSVSGNNLTNMCKLIYKVCREEKNDEHFLRDNLLDLLIETIHSPDQEISWEALVYCVGALKFLTANSSISKILVKRGAIETLSDLLQRAVTTTENNGKSMEEVGNILVQLTASLRNLADVSQSREHFMATKTLQHLCSVMTQYRKDSDLMLNISRLLSKLTLHADCCCVIAGLDCYKSFTHILRDQPNKENLVVRACFVLGNLAAKSDHARISVYDEPGCIEALINIIKLYMKKLRRSKGDKSTSTSEDVLVKVIRVMANLSINETVGSNLVNNKSCLLELISILDTVTVDTHEELVLNTIATLNNLTFYSSQAAILDTNLISIADNLLKHLEPSHTDSLLESARVFGNLTRDPGVRDYLFDKKPMSSHASTVPEMMVALLDSDNRELVYTACGVLVNFMADQDKRSVLKTEGGIGKLLDALNDLGRGDWHLAAVVCQLLWNYSTHIHSSVVCFGEIEAPRLAEILIELTDEEAAFDPAVTPDDEETAFIHDVWTTEFCPVAMDLLKRVERHTSQFVALT